MKTFDVSFSVAMVTVYRIEAEDGEDAATLVGDLAADERSSLPRGRTYLDENVIDVESVDS